MLQTPIDTCSMTTIEYDRLKQHQYRAYGIFSVCDVQYYYPWLLTVVGEVR